MTEQDTGALVTVERRFWSKVDKTADCWIWMGGRSGRRGGYGVFRFEGRQQPASRVAWVLANGQPWPEGMFACHHCDNPPCVRPDHIFPGTQRDNMQDSIRKGRFVYATGNRSGACKWGHPYTPENTIVYNSRGHWMCRKCHRYHEAVRRDARVAQHWNPTDFPYDLLSRRGALKRLLDEMHIWDNANA